MMLSMFVNDRRDNWHEMLPFVMQAYRTSVHESTGYSPYRLMMGEECSLPQDLNTEELRSSRENEVAPHPFAAWVRDALEVAYDQVRHSLNRKAGRPLIVNFQLDRGFCDITHRRLKRSWDTLGLDPNRWYDKQPATLLAYKRTRTPPLSSYTLMT